MQNQFITRVFLSSLVLALTSLFGGGNLLAQTEVFYESFDKCAGTGGNDGQWSGSSIANKTLSADNRWTFASGSGADKCAKFGTTKNLGSATTPALGFEGDATLTFKAGAWSGDQTTLNISILGGGSLTDESGKSVSEVTMLSGAWTEYTINITNATTSTQIKFEGYQASKARFFLDEVKITQASSSDPGDTKTNPELAYGVREYNATIGQDNAFPALTHADGVTGIVYSSSEESVATVDKDGNVTLKGIEGSTTIKASIKDNETWKDAEAFYTLNVSKPSANLAYSASSCTVIVGEAAELPTLTYTEGVTGIVYASSNTDVATVNATTGEVTLTGAEGTTVISATLTGNATFADGSASYTLTVTDKLLAQTVDKLTADMLEATSTGYKDFSGVTATSSAVYAGNSANNSGAIQLRGKDNSGIVTTASGGKVTKVVLTWASGATKDRTVDVYGKSTAYSTAADLYSSESTKGKCIGSMTYDGSATITTLNITEDYEYIGIRSKSNALQLNSVEITWASADDPSDNRTNPELAYGVSEYNATIDQTEGFPTLTHADDVTGITYSSSDETVATVDESGNVTLKGIEGTTTITASISNSQTWKDDEASYTLIVSKPSANLAYSASSCHVVIGEDYTLPTLTYTEGVTGIVFDSSDESVATVDAEGVVTLTGSVGKTTITASLTGDATYADGSASYELTVKKPNVFVYKKVTSAEDLIKGATYVFVCEGTNKVGTAVSDKKMQPTNATLTDGILEESVDEPMEFVLDIKDGKYCFISGGKYLKGADGTDLTMVFYSTTDEAIKWNILFDEVKGALIWNTYGANNGTGRRLMYRSSKDYNVFGHYAGTIGTEYYNVQLYQKVYPLTVSSATSGYATFYNEEEAYKMPEGLTGYAVTKAENGTYITRKTAYEAGATVPAKTPLLIIGTTEGGNYYPAVVSGTGVEAYAGSNLLEGKRDANGYTSYANDGSVYYYKLGLNAEKLGFYWGAEGGAAFQMQKATTAYLAVPKKLVEGANALFFDFGPETGINEIQTEQADKAIFDLSGRRVQKATKGFYIVGGKKVLVK